MDKKFVDIDIVLVGEGLQVRLATTSEKMSITLLQSNKSVADTAYHTVPDFWAKWNEFVVGSNVQALKERVGHEPFSQTGRLLGKLY